MQLRRVRSCHLMLVWPWLVKCRFSSYVRLWFKELLWLSLLQLIVTKNCVVDHRVLYTWRRLFLWLFADTELTEVSKNSNYIIKTYSKVMLILKISRMWFKNKACPFVFWTQNGRISLDFEATKKCKKSLITKK